MNLLKFILISAVIILSAPDAAYAKDGPSKDEAITCVVMFNMARPNIKDAKTGADVEKVANMFTAYLIKQGMQEQEYVSLYDAKVKEISDGLASNRLKEDRWKDMADECEAFTDDL